MCKVGQLSLIVFICMCIYFHYLQQLWKWYETKKKGSVGMTQHVQQSSSEAVMKPTMTQIFETNYVKNRTNEWTNILWNTTLNQTY